MNYLTNAGFLLIASVALILVGCSKKPNDGLIPEEPELIFLVEDFRTSGMSDYETIQAACDSVPDGAILLFADKTYTVDHTVFVHKSLTFRGPATIRRARQIEYRLASPISPGSRTLTLNTTEGLKVRDYFLLTSGEKDFKSTTSMNLISSIDGNTITTYYPIHNFINGSADFKTGTLFLKDVKFFWILDKDPGVFPTQTCTFTKLVFDGNRYHNQSTYSWLINYAMEAGSKGVTKIDSCLFVNSPGETVVGHNLKITNSVFKNLNGSAIHTAIDRLHVSEDEINSVFTNNLFENTNEIPTKVGGHSEGCITHSNSGGYYTAKNNKFINVGEAVLGLLYPSVSQNDWGTSNILFTENEIRTTGRMVYSFGLLPGPLENVRILDNYIYELNPWPWEEALEYYPDVVLENQVNQSDP